MVAKKRAYKIDLFPLLRNISTKNIAYYDTLTEENLKEFSPYVIMRWLTGCSGADNARQILFLNEFVNPYAFELTLAERRGVRAQHKKLLYNLLTVCTSGRDCRYKFVKTNPKRQSEFPISVGIIQKMFDYSYRDANATVVLFTDENIINMGTQLGLQKTEITNLKKELRKRK